jgi:hypothetical protein
MAKKSRKLALRKETLRKLDDRQLAQVAGGDYGDMVVLKLPYTNGSGSCETIGCLDASYYAYYIYY